MTRCPSAASRSATSFQLEESAKAPWTRMTVVFTVVPLGRGVRFGARASGEQAAEYPGRRLVRLDALGEESPTSRPPHSTWIDAGFVMRLLDGGEDGLGGADDEVLAGDEAADHLGRVRPVVLFGNRGVLGELAVPGRRQGGESADALGDLVDGGRELVVLRLVQGVRVGTEPRARQPSRVVRRPCRPRRCSMLVWRAGHGWLSPSGRSLRGLPPTLLVHGANNIGQTTTAGSSPVT